MDAAAQAKESTFVDTLRNRKTRSLSIGEREEIARDRREQAEDRSRDSLRLQLGRHQQGFDEFGAGTRQGALERQPEGLDLRGRRSHRCDGGETYNQDLSERRADTIKKYLTEKYGIAGANLVTVGYGKTKPKDSNAPLDPVNRRVQVVNMETKTASK